MKIGNLSEPEDWIDFKIELTRMYPLFLDTLGLKHTGLSLNETKVCVLLFLDCTTKQIAKILNREPHSIDAVRSRLRKKLHLKEKENLREYLKKLSEF
jgi:DNA-binding CsgD family transcriptional regulator